MRGYRAATRKDPTYQKEQEVRLVLRHLMATTSSTKDVFSTDPCIVDESTPEVVYQDHEGERKPFVYVDFPIDAIRTLWLGPSFGDDKKKADLQQFLRSNNVDETVVRNTKRSKAT